MKDHTPTQPKPAAARTLKAALGQGRGAQRHQRNDAFQSLKQRVRSIANGSAKADPELVELANRWLHNKKADPHKAPLHVGATRKTKGSKASK